MEVGDKNVKFFQKYVEHLKNLNTIWSLKNEDGLQISDQENLSQLVHSHFESHYKEGSSISARDQIKVIK